jgi:hypothetical protein
MSERITQRDLEAVCARINRTVNGDAGKVTRVKNGDFWDEWPTWTRETSSDGPGALRQVPNIYSISYAYGGASLHRNCTADANGESHGVHDVFGSGHMPKRELYERMQAFLRGFEAS